MHGRAMRCGAGNQVVALKQAHTIEVWRNGRGGWGCLHKGAQGVVRYQCMNDPRL